MVSALIALLVTILVVGIVAAIIIYMLDLLPIDGRFITALKALVLLIAVLVIILRALPLLTGGSLG